MAFYHIFRHKSYYLYTSIVNIETNGFLKKHLKPWILNNSQITQVSH
jgi:hypothetical protein